MEEQELIQIYKEITDLYNKYKDKMTLADRKEVEAEIATLKKLAAEKKIDLNQKVAALTGSTLHQPLLDMVNNAKELPDKIKASLSNKILNIKNIAAATEVTQQTIANLEKFYKEKSGEAKLTNDELMGVMLYCIDKTGVRTAYLELQDTYDKAANSKALKIEAQGKRSETLEEEAAEVIEMIDEERKAAAEEQEKADKLKKGEKVEDKEEEEEEGEPNEFEAKKDLWKGKPYYKGAFSMQASFSVSLKFVVNELLVKEFGAERKAAVIVAVMDYLTAKVPFDKICSAVIARSKEEDEEPLKDLGWATLEWANEPPKVPKDEAEALKKPLSASVGLALKVDLKKFIPLLDVKFDTPLGEFIAMESSELSGTFQIVFKFDLAAYMGNVAKKQAIKHLDDALKKADIFIDNVDNADKAISKKAVGEMKDLIWKADDVMKKTPVGKKAVEKVIVEGGEKIRNQIIKKAGTKIAGKLILKLIPVVNVISTVVDVIELGMALWDWWNSDREAPDFIMVKNYTINPVDTKIADAPQFYYDNINKHNDSGYDIIDLPDKK